MKPKTCDGYGRKQGRCTNLAGGEWSPFYCRSCDTDRVQAMVKKHPDLRYIFYGERKRTTAA